MRRAFFFCLFVPLCLGAGAAVSDEGDGQDGPIVWSSDLDEALAAARTEFRPILLVFSAPSCGWCKQLKNEVLPRPEIAQLLKNYVRVEIDISSDRETAAAYGVRSVPALRLLNAEGEVRDARNGMVPSTELAKMLTGALNAEFLKNQPGQAADILKGLESNAVTKEDWPKVLAALGDPNLAGTVRPVVMRLSPFPRADLVEMLKSPDLHVRLGALDVLEQKAGETFGFDPWGDLVGEEENIFALDRWESWATTGETEADDLQKELSRNEVEEILPGLLSENVATSVSAFRRLERGGEKVVSHLGHIIQEKKELPELSLRSLKADQYALAMAGNGRFTAEIRERGRDLLFGNLDSRTRAISELPGVAGPTAVPILLELLDDPEPILREAVVDSLVKTGRRKIAPPLAEHLKNERDRNVAYTILRGLGQLRSKTGLEALIEHIQHDDEDIAIVSIEGVKRLGVPTESAKEAIIEAIGDSRWRVRVAAIGAAEKLRLRESAPAIEKLLRDSDDFVQQAAVSALAAVGGEESFEKMAELFGEEGAPKTAILDAYLSNEKPIPQDFIEALKAEEPDILLPAIESFGRNVANHVELFEELVGSDNIDVATTAARVVAGYGGRVPEAQSLLTSIFRDGRPEIKEAAVSELEVRQSPSYYRQQEGVSLDLIREKSEEERALAEQAVLAFVDEFSKFETSIAKEPENAKANLEEMVQAVRDLTRSERPLTRFYASVFLLSSGRPGGLEPALAELDQRTESERYNLAYALRRSDDLFGGSSESPDSSDPTELLRRLIRDPSQKVRNMALYTCLSGGTKTSLLAFEEALSEDSQIHPADLWDAGLDSIVEEGELGDELREQALTILRDGGEVPWVSLALFMFEGSMGQDEIEVLEPYLRADEAIHRRAAYRAFAKSQPSKFLEVIDHAAEDASPLVRAVIPNVFARLSGRWIYYFDDKHTVTGWTYYSPYSMGRSGRTSSELPAEAKGTLLELATGDDPKLRLESLFTLMSNGEQIDVDLLLETINQFPDRGVVESRIVSYLEDNYAQLDPKHYRRLGEFLSGADPDDRELAAVLRHFGTAGAEAEVQLTLLEARPPDVLPDDISSNPFGFPDEKPAPPPEVLKVVYFEKPGCDICAKVSGYIEELGGDFPEMVLEKYDTSKQATIELQEAMSERFKVPPELRVAPLVFTSGGYAAKNEANYQGLMRLFARTMNTPEFVGWDEFKEEELQAAVGKIEERFTSFGFAVVAGAGLLDGINPCAFATIIFFMSYLQVARRNAKQILQVGIAFILAVFLTYFIIGMGLLGVVSKLHEIQWVGQILNWVFAAIAFVIMILCIRDGFLCMRGRLQDTTLQLPEFLKKRIRDTIRTGARHRNFVIAAFVVGIVISVLELACTGQVYLPTIGYMIGQGNSVAYWYLLLYNLAFVLPLVIIFGLALTGMKSDALIRFQKDHTAAVKFGTAAIFLALGLFLVFHTLDLGYKEEETETPKESTELHEAPREALSWRSTTIETDPD